MAVPVSPRLSKKLHQVLGQEAEDLVTWLDEERAERQEQFDTLRADIAELRQEMRSSPTKVEIAAQFHTLEAKLREQIHAVDKRVVQAKGDLMMWSFVFWVGAVAAIAMLAKVLP